MGDDSFEIRPITENDLEEVLRIYQQSEDFLALGSEPKASMAMVVQDIETSRHDNGVFSGIYAPNGDLVGVVDYVPADYSGCTHIAFISLLMIGAPLRNQGIGTKILRLVETKIRETSQVSEIQTAVQLDNPAAFRFWERNDYRSFGNLERRPDQTEVSYLRKSLLTSD